MTPQLDYVTSLLDQYTAEYATWKDGACAERARQARAHVLAKHVHPTETAGVYLVDSSSEPGVQYRVNGLCECMDARTRAPYGACKHRIAAKLYDRILGELTRMRTEGVVHTHTYRCGHDAPECWDAQCARPIAQIPVACADCLKDEGDAEMAQDLTSTTEHWSGPHGCHEDCPACQDEADELAPLTYHETDGYEVNPQTRLHAAGCPAIQGKACDCVPATTTVLPPTQQSVPTEPAAMPEAPASLNIKIKKGTMEAMYTLRSMQGGAAGDAELAQRLPKVLELLRTLTPPWES